jgi:hypothetical protein
MHHDTIAVSLLDKEYQLRPTFRVATGIQQRTNKTLAQAIFAAKQLSIIDIHAIICAGLIGNGYDSPEDAIGDAIIADYRTTEMKLINSIIQFGESFFPKVENDGTKKQTATEVIG